MKEYANWAMIIAQLKNVAEINEAIVKQNKQETKKLDDAIAELQYIMKEERL